MTVQGKTNAQLVTEYNAMASTLGLKAVKKFRTIGEGVQRCQKLSAKMPKDKKKQNGKRRYGENIHIAIVAKENPRLKGTRVYKSWDEMVEYLKGHPDASLADVIAATSYRRIDYIWDTERGSIRKVG